MAATGSYAINGQALPLEPTEGSWISQRSLGRSGAGFDVLAPVFSFEIKWGLMKKSEFNDLMQIVYSVSGAVVPVAIPDFDSDTYEFYAYTGCVVNKPTVSRYFTENVTGVTLMITSIATRMFKSI